MLLDRKLTVTRVNTLNLSNCPVLRAPSAVVPILLSARVSPILLSRSLVPALRRERDGRHVLITRYSAVARAPSNGRAGGRIALYFTITGLPARRFGVIAAGNIDFSSPILHGCPLPLVGEDNRLHVFITLHRRPFLLPRGDDGRLVPSNYRYCRSLPPSGGFQGDVSLPLPQH